MRCYETTAPVIMTHCVGRGRFNYILSMISMMITRSLCGSPTVECYIHDLPLLRLGSYPPLQVPLHPAHQSRQLTAPGRHVLQYLNNLIKQASVACGGPSSMATVGAYWPTSMLAALMWWSSRTSKWLPWPRWLLKMLASLAPRSWLNRGDRCDYPEELLSHKACRPSSQ